MLEHHSQSNVCCQLQYQTLFTDVFHVDLNADVTLVALPIETAASLAVFVTEAPAPAMNRRSKSLRSFCLGIFIENQNQLDQLSFFIHAAEHG